MRKIFLALLVLIANPGFAQDKILMLSGHVVEGNVIDQNHKLIKYEYEKRNKTKTKEIDTYRVFSITDENGDEKVLYKRDSTNGNYLAEKEMRHFIYGAQDAMENYKGRWAFISATAIGGAGGYLLANSFLVITIPLVYPIVTSIHKIHPKEGKVKHPNLLNDPAYKAGYTKNTKSKRFFQALKGSLLGTAVGVSAFYAVN